MIIVKDSDSYDYFKTNYAYSETGPPAYVVFKNVDYDDPENFNTMNQIASEMTYTLSETVLGPVYSWVGPFQNFIKKDQVWD